MTKKKSIILIAIALIILSAVGYFLYSKTSHRLVNSEQSQATYSKDDQNVNIADGQRQITQNQDLDIIYGSEDAAVTIIEYASYGCSHCANFFVNIVSQLKEKYIASGKVRLILRDFPLDEPSLRASQLVHCTPVEQKKEFIDTLFKTQTEWAYNKEFLQNLEKITAKLGMSQGIFQECVKNDVMEGKILKSRVEAYQYFNINSTPSLIINGQKYVGNIKFADIASYIDNLLK